MAAESIVLLKNEGNILPLRKEKLASLMVVGPNAFSFDALAGIIMAYPRGWKPSWKG